MPPLQGTIFEHMFGGGGFGGQGAGFGGGGQRMRGRPVLRTAMRISFEDAVKGSTKQVGRCMEQRFISRGKAQHGAARPASCGVRRGAVPCGAALRPNPARPPLPPGHAPC